MKEKRRKPVIVGLLSVLLLTTVLSLTVYGDVPLRGSHHPGRIIASAAGPTSLNLSDFRPVRMRHGSFFLERDFMPLIQGPRGHVLIQLTQPLNPVIEQELRAQGVELLEYIPENTWKALVPAAELAAVKALNSVQAMGSVYPVDKFPVYVLERGLASFSLNEDGTISVLVSFYADVPFERVERILVDLDGTTEQSDFISGHRALLTIPADSLSALAEYDEISWIENRPRPKRSGNANAAALSNVDNLHTAPYSLDGMAVPIAIWDGGEVQANHPDLAGRITIVDVSAVDEHATHVAGIMISSGAGNPDAKGMAPAADLYAYDFYGDIPMEMSDAVNSYDAILANQSITRYIGWEYNYYKDGYWVWFGDEDFGNYTSYSQTWDQTVIDTDMIVVKAAGNHRNDDGDQDRTGHRHFDIPEDPEIYDDYHPMDGNYTCIDDIGSSKNSITVGAVFDTGGMSSFSSYGPCLDGRLKPDLVANGFDLTSTCPIGTYCSMSGTSQATPVVTGSIALIAQRYAQLMGADPEPDMIKAILVGTAFELGEKGPEYSFGWGLMDAKSAVDLVENGSTLIRTGTVSNGGILEYPLTITTRDKVVRVTLAWTDPAGSPAAAEALVNDMDLELVDSGSTVHLPWVLDGSNPSLPAFKGVNAVDNIEQVHVTFPAAGTWTIRVKGTSIQGSQSFALVTSLSDEFQVNTSSGSWSGGVPSSAGLTNGGFAVVWDSADLLYATVDTYGRVFDAQGYPTGEAFRLNQTTTDTQETPAVAALSGGGFTAVWASEGQDGSHSGVYGRVFDNNGNPATAEFQVNVYTNFDQQAPVVAGLNDGSFVVVWESKVQDGSDRGVFARLFNASGGPLTNDIQVNTTTWIDQSGPSVAALQSGGFVVSWKSWDQDGSGYGIVGRVFDGTGTPQTSEFQVNTHTPLSQDSCAVGGLLGGGFVIVWRSYAQDGDGGGIYGKMFDAGGNKVGGEFQVNTYTQNEQTHPTVSALPGGGFIVIWQSDGQDGNLDGIFARNYDSNGNPQATEYQLNIYSVHDQTAPCSALLTGGDVLAAWESIIQGSGKKVFARLLKTAEDCPCDLNNDGSCNILDWPYFIEDWGRTDCNEPTVECECDLNVDGKCNILDWPYFIEDWGRTDCPIP